VKYRPDSCVDSLYLSCVNAVVGCSKNIKGKLASSDFLFMYKAPLQEYSPLSTLKSLAMQHAAHTSSTRAIRADEKGTSRKIGVMPLDRNCRVCGCRWPNTLMRILSTDGQPAK
jgi:hypothetical protein